MYISFNYSGVHLVANIKNKITILRGYSGIGKTFFIKILNTYFNLNDLRSRIFNIVDLYNISINKFKMLIEDYDFLFLDNADIYLIQEMYDCIVDSGKYCIIVLHSSTSFYLHDSEFESLIYEGKLMKLGGD